MHPRRNTDLLAQERWYTRVLTPELHRHDATRSHRAKRSPARTTAVNARRSLQPKPSTPGVMPSRRRALRGQADASMQTLYTLGKTPHALRWLLRAVREVCDRVQKAEPCRLRRRFRSQRHRQLPRFVRGESRPATARSSLLLLNSTARGTRLATPSLQQLVQSSSRRLDDLSE